MWIATFFTTLFPGLWLRVIAVGAVLLVVGAATFGVITVIDHNRAALIEQAQLASQEQAKAELAAKSEQLVRESAAKQAVEMTRLSQQDATDDAAWDTANEAVEAITAPTIEAPAVNPTVAEDSNVNQTKPSPAVAAAIAALNADDARLDGLLERASGAHKGKR